MQLMERERDKLNMMFDRQALLPVLAHVGRVVGPCEAVDIYLDGDLAIAKVTPIKVVDPLLPIPLADAPPKAWEALASYWAALTTLLDKAQSGDDTQHYKRRAVDCAERATAAFSRHLDTATLGRFRQWLFIALMGVPTVNGGGQ